MIEGKTYKELQEELDEIRFQLQEANELIHAIRTGQVDALVINEGEGHQLYTLKSADHTYRVFIDEAWRNVEGLAEWKRLPQKELLRLIEEVYFTPK